MLIKRLKIQNLRNIVNAEICPGKNLNFFSGPNAAGKTSLLESIYLLARARSFRPSQNRNLINKNENELIIFSELIRSDNSLCKIGLKKDKRKTQIKSDGREVKKLSELAHNLPISVLTPNIQRLIEEGPEQRRKLLNWGLFHVEHSYTKLARNYSKVLQQRNKALFGRKEDVTIWTNQLAHLGEMVADKQQQYTELWIEQIERLKVLLPVTPEFKLDYVRGWKADTTLEETLMDSYESDRDRGFTTHGPHRMDVKISSQGRAIKHDYSRGQKKIIACLLMLAQTSLIKVRSQESPIILADDLHAELDIETYQSLLRLITQLQLQTFITTLDKSYAVSQSGELNRKMFHVEHGDVNEIL
ncbi:MAG: DNA replication/repair protein RecF [Candidatus Thiodiazotropha sp.]